jgi:hypothetical protein
MPGRAERVTSSRVSGRYADVQRVRAQAGCWIDDADNEGGSSIRRGHTTASAIRRRMARWAPTSS